MTDDIWAAHKALTIVEEDAAGKVVQRQNMTRYEFERHYRARLRGKQHLAQNAAVFYSRSTDEARYDETSGTITVSPKKRT